MSRKVKPLLVFIVILVMVKTLKAQTVTWHDDGSLEVTGKKVFYSYIPENFDDSYNMVHLDVNALFGDPNLFKSLVKGYTDASSNSSNILKSHQVRFEVYTYDSNAPDKIGSFIYGHDNDSWSRTKKETPFDPVHDNPYYELLGVTKGRSSINPKFWFAKAKIPIPNDADCLKKGMSRDEFSVMTVIGKVELAASVYSGPKLAVSLGRGTSLAAKGVFVNGRSLKWLLKRFRKRIVFSAIKKGGPTAGVFALGGLAHKIFTAMGDSERCIRYASSIQPVIIKLIIENSRVYSHKIAGYDVELKPKEIFKKDADKWDDTNFSNLFRNDNKVTIAAHRGYWRKAGVAQNSLGALMEASNRSDADMIELDVRSTKDKMPICFHDDKPQKILLQTATTFPHKSVYDLDWNTLKSFYLYDRHGTQTTETLVSLEQAFKYYVAQNIQKPINLDIGIPAKVPKNGRLVGGQPFFDAVFLKAVGLAAKYKITNRIIFKGKYTVDNPIWNKVKDTLRKYKINKKNGFKFNPIIAYTPKFGDDTGLGTSYPIAYRQKYLNDWLDDTKRLENQFMTVVGMEVRLKNNQDTAINNELLNAIVEIKKKSFGDKDSEHLKVGIFSETPSTCQGYWTKSASERYIDFTVEKRNNFDWILNHSYDYIITDFPNVLNQLRTARSSN